MNPYYFPIALIGFLAFVALMPAWTWFTTEWSHTSALSEEAMFLALLALPATITMFLASWIQS